MNGTIQTETTGAVTGGLKTLLRLEGLTLFAGMTLLYAVRGESWWVYAILFLARASPLTSVTDGKQASAVVPLRQGPRST